MSCFITVIITPGNAAVSCPVTVYTKILTPSRKQARLGYLSPAAFTQQFYASQLAA
jgi:hypothetical protein